VCRERGKGDLGVKAPVAEASDECAMCLVVYELGDRIRCLPCSHIYHTQCIDRWLTGAEGRTCPLCKADPLRDEP
jgi:hypothetical protein